MKQARINTFLPHNNELSITSFFGHSSHGVPGLEIVGLGTYGKVLKEKIIYLTKSRNLKFPLLRYVICKEGSSIAGGSFKDGFDAEWFDLPIFILYLSLGQHLMIGRLENCLALGKIRPCGEVQISSLWEQKISLYLSELNYILISPKKTQTNSNEREDSKIIPLENLFESIPDFQFKLV